MEEGFKDFNEYYQVSILHAKEGESQPCNSVQLKQIEGWIHAGFLSGALTELTGLGRVALITQILQSQGWELVKKGILKKNSCTVTFGAGWVHIEAANPRRTGMYRVEIALQALGCSPELPLDRAKCAIDFLMLRNSQHVQPEIEFFASVVSGLSIGEVRELLLSMDDQYMEEMKELELSILDFSRPLEEMKALAEKHQPENTREEGQTWKSQPWHSRRTKKKR